MRYLALILLIGSVSMVAGSAASSNFSYDVPRYSVDMRGVSPRDIAFLEDQGFLVEWARADKARLYVDPEQEELLLHLGYRPVRVEQTVPLVPYPSIDDIYDAIDDVVAAHPDICRKVTIGTSVEGRPIEAVVVSNNVASEEIEPEMRIQGAIHGDEMASATTTLNYLEVLTDNYATSSMCQYIVDNTESWIIPVLNPDGYYHDQRYNANGIDLNRNLSYMGPGGGGGSTAFSEPETQALRDLTMQDWPAVSNFINPFTAGLSLHGGAACFNAPWNYSDSAELPDSLLMLSQGSDYAGSPGIVSYFASFPIYVPGADWYPTNGDVNDWSYGECGTVDQTIEVHSDKHVSDWPGVSNAHYMAIVEFFTKSTYGIWGTVTDTSGNPVDAQIMIGLHDGTDSEPLQFCRTDVTLGDYHKTLLPGNYDVEVSAEGYNPQSVIDVAVGSEERVEVSFVLSGTGIEEHGFSTPVSGFTSYPNPSMGSCTFTLPVTGVEGTVTIYDITGRSVVSSPVSSSMGSFQWSNSDETGQSVPSGMYIARYSSGGAVWSTRLIVNDR